MYSGSHLPIGMRFNERSRSAPEQLMIIGNQKLDSAHFLTLLPLGLMAFHTEVAGYYLINSNTEPLPFSLYYLSGKPCNNLLLGLGVARRATKCEFACGAIECRTSWNLLPARRALLLQECESFKNRAEFI
jgi:hypothetical protein